MKYNKGFAPLILVAIIVGALVIGGGAYYLGKSGSKQEVKSPENVLPNNENQNLPVVDNSQQVNVANTTTSTVATGCTSTSTPSIKVLSPNGGETYTAGQKITVKWESCNVSSSISAGGADIVIFISNLSGSGLPNWMLGEATKNDGQELITLPVTLPDGSPLSYGKNFKISVGKNDPSAQSEGIGDSSDNLFTILSNSKESSEKQIGYIKSIYSKDNTNYLTIDYVQWTYCDTDDCAASIKVINDNPLIRTFPISKDVQVKLATYPDASGNYSLNQNLSLSKFKEALDYSLNHTFNPAHPPEVYYPKTLLYWITIENGVVTKIEEQFQA